MIRSFKEDKDIYSFIAAIAFNKTYEECKEFTPTGEYNPEGKARRTEAKSVLLGILYGRSVVTIADQLYSHEPWSDEKKIKTAQYVYDSVLKAFPALHKLMVNSETFVKKYGYVETILGRRRHIPDMQLPEYTFEPLPGYVNPDIDPLDMSTFTDDNGIPQRIQDSLYKELKSYKYFGQVTKRIRELAEVDKIKVHSNRYKIQEAQRQIINCVDVETEILTTTGWKRYDEVHVGDEILSYNLDAEKITRDTVQNVHIYNGDFNVVNFETNTFSAVSTPEHRWVCQNTDHKARFMTTDHICKLKWPEPPIVRVDDNDLPDGDYADAFLRLVGWVLTDGHIKSLDKPYGMFLFQDVKREKGQLVYDDMLDTLSELGVEYSLCKSNSDTYKTLYLRKCDVTIKIRNMFPNRVLTYDFISSLSQKQAKIVVDTMIQGDGWINASQCAYACGTEEKADLFQYLCYVAGYASRKRSVERSGKKSFGKVSNDGGFVETKKTYWLVYILRRNRAHVYPKDITRSNVPIVWCVTTGNGSWVARRNGIVYVTGNSMVQGSAADLTKLAMLMVDRDPEWNRLGGRVLVPVHDEIIAEVPIEHWKEGGDRLSQMMCEAASFLPFTIKCDVTTTYRWNGMEYPCRYAEPKSMDDLSEDEIKWVQYHLFEIGYELPVFNEPNGEKPRGDAALGVNGIPSDEFYSYIEDYCNRYKILKDDFVYHIHTKVHTGYFPGEQH